MVKICYKCERKVSIEELNEVDEIIVYRLNEDQSEIFAKILHGRGIINCCKKCIEGITGFDGCMTNHNDNNLNLQMCETCGCIYLNNHQCDPNMAEFDCEEVIDNSNIVYIGAHECGTEDDSSVDPEDYERERDCEERIGEITDFFEEKGKGFLIELRKAFAEIYNNAEPCCLHQTIGEVIKLKDDLFEIVQYNLDIHQDRVDVCVNEYNHPITTKIAHESYEINAVHVVKTGLLKFQQSLNFYDWDYCVENFLRKHPDQYILRQKLENGQSIMM